jgi:hypothetical protein
MDIAPVPRGSGLYKAACNLAPLLGDTIGIEYICGLILRVKYNSFPISNIGLHQNIGTGLFPSAAYFNHECWPTAHYFCDRTDDGEWRLIFRGNKPAPAGTPATIAYIDTYFPIAVRQQMLRDGYMFNCTCVTSCNSYLPALFQEPDRCCWWLFVVNFCFWFQMQHVPGPRLPVPRNYCSQMLEM